MDCVLGKSINQSSPVDGLDVLGGSQDGPAQRRSLVGDGVEVVEHDLLEVHLNLLHFAQDHAALALNLL